MKKTFLFIAMIFVSSGIASMHDGVNVSDQPRHVDCTVSEKEVLYRLTAIRQWSQDVANNCFDSRFLCQRWWELMEDAEKISK